jgi:hypothetical protein
MPTPSRRSPGAARSPCRCSEPEWIGQFPSVNGDKRGSHLAPIQRCNTTYGARPNRQGVHRLEQAGAQNVLDQPAHHSLRRRRGTPGETAPLQGVADLGGERLEWAASRLQRIRCRTLDASLVLHTDLAARSARNGIGIFGATPGTSGNVTRFRETSPGEVGCSKFGPRCQTSELSLAPRFVIVGGNAPTLPSR